MKPRKAARRRKRPNRTPSPKPPQQWLTRGEKTFLKCWLWLFAAYCLYNGYAYGFNYTQRHPNVSAWMFRHGFLFPHTWLGRQLGWIHLPTREAVAQSVGQPTERIYYIHSDHLGSPLLLTDSNQQVVWRANAEPFGKTTPTANQIVFNLRSPGQYEDRETGLTHNNLRTYDSRTGNYREPDPIGQAGGLNLYAYAFNNPVKWIDPLGLGDRIDFPIDRTRPPGAGPPRGPAKVHDLSDYSPRQPVMDPKAIICRVARVAGTAAAAVAAGYSTYCAGSRGFCYLGQSAMSPCECMQVFDESGACCLIPGGGPECNPEPNSCQE